MAAIVAGVAALLIAIVVVGSMQGGGGNGAATSAAANDPIVPVRHFSEPMITITSRGALVPIPRSFLGFSTEYWTLPVDERH
ncbi:MAG: hypothetical protein M3025_02805, partial [Actinomycetota bacterium]|nr:hypothetical protein [Actinomycetota bacterium]